MKSFLLALVVWGGIVLSVPRLVALSASSCSNESAWLQFFIRSFALLGFVGTVIFCLVALYIGLTLTTNDNMKFRHPWGKS
jgi:hypothetical protein